MATRSRIGLRLADDSILSVYHHWDGYPQWLGVTLRDKFNTKEKVAELIDGGDMGSCYSDNEYNEETQEFEKIDPRPTYYGGDDNSPVLSKNFDEFTRIDCWQEYSYVFVKDRWEAYSISQQFNEDFTKMTHVNVRSVEIPEGKVEA